MVDEKVYGPVFGAGKAITNDEAHRVRIKT